MSDHNSPSLGIDEIAELSQRVFSSKRETIDTAADRYGFAALCSTVAQVLDEISVLVTDLPEAAFLPQPDDIDGSDVWSAGEIVSHLAEMEMSALPFWEMVSGCDFPDPPATLLKAIQHPPLSESACSDVLSAMRTRSAQTFATIARVCDGDERAVHFAIGNVSVKAAILGSCIHLVDHYQQLSTLMTRSNRG